MLLAIIAFLQAHQAAIAAAVVGVVDLAVEVNPHLAGNNIISQLLHLLKLKGPSKIDVALDKLKVAASSEEKLAIAEELAKILAGK